MIILVLVGVTVLNMVRSVHELRVLINMVWSVRLIQVVVFLGIFGMGMESLVMAMLVGLKLLHPRLC